MKNKRLTISAIILLLAAVSCTKTINTPLPHEIMVPSGIDAVAEEFLNFYEDEDLSFTRTRSQLDISGDDYQFVWAATDSIGIFPDEGGQVSFSMETGAGTRNASFDGGGWGLKASHTYTAYYPLVGDFYLDKSAIPYDLSGQTQDGNSSSAHLNKLDYMCTEPTTVGEDGRLQFKFKHHICVFHFLLTVPEKAKYTSLSLYSTGKMTTTGEMNLSEGSVNTETDTHIQTITLNNISLSAKEVLNVYLAAAPANLEGQILKVEAVASSGKKYSTYLNGTDYQAGAFYHYKRTITQDTAMTGLPVVFVNTTCTQDEIVKETWTEGGKVAILNPDTWELEYSGGTSVKGRGNTTWKECPKKPYALKLDSKGALLGMAKHKRWCLLANYLDRTLLRNAVAFEIAKCTSLEWTPSGQFVELVFNGVHRGNYFLCEQIKVDKNRVNIAELDPEAMEGDAISGGYIIELDTYYDEVNKFKSTYYDLPYMFKDPDEVNAAQFVYLQNYVNEMESCLNDDAAFKAGTYKDYLDLDSFADYWIVCELTRNREVNHPKSSYMNKDLLGKIKAGPVWDFDWETFTPISSLKSYEITGIYYSRLMQDPEFKATVKEHWNAMKPQLQAIPDKIESLSKQIEASEAVNWSMWPITKDGSWFWRNINGDIYKSFPEAVSRMKNAYTAKLNWMDNLISSF